MAQNGICEPTFASLGRRIAGVGGVAYWCAKHHVEVGKAQGPVCGLAAVDALDIFDDLEVMLELI